jgi:hypothetical protein
MMMMMMMMIIITSDCNKDNFQMTRHFLMAGNRGKIPTAHQKMKGGKSRTRLSVPTTGTDCRSDVCNQQHHGAGKVA